MHTLSTPYNPSANNLSERINRQIALDLRLFKGSRIKKAAKQIEFSINAGNNRTLGFSSYELVNKVSCFDPFQRRLEIKNEEIEKRVRHTDIASEEKQNATPTKTFSQGTMFSF